MKNIDFIGSYPSVRDCPRIYKPEFAFIGRSNVGKSSLVNMLCKRNHLARVSKQPGKTQLINYFLIDKEWYLVDLPGYGYAKVSKKTRVKWEKMVKDYLRTRATISCIFMLLDLNVELQQIDLEFINWMGSHGLPFVLVYTKADRLKENEKEEQEEKIKAALSEYWNELPPQFRTSSNTGEGRSEILHFIDDINAQKP